MYYFLRVCIDTLFPPSHDARIVHTLTNDTLDTLYVPRQYQETYALTRYSESTIRALIHEAKFKNNTVAQTYLGMFLTRFLHTHHFSIPTYIVPIPLAPARKRARGYNQVERVIAYATLPSYCILNTTLLTRTQNTKPQTSLKKAERLTNMDNCFKAENPSRLRNTHILLIDDVTTTGATLREAKAALKPHKPASITCLALAH